MSLNIKDKGIDINKFDKYDRPPLYHAIVNRRYEIAKLLIDKGAKVNIKVENDMTLGNLDLIRLIVEKYKHDINDVDEHNTSALHNAVLANNLEIVKYLVKKGIDINIKTTWPYYGDIILPDNWTAIQYARKLKYKEIEKYLKSLKK